MKMRQDASGASGFVVRKRPAEEGRKRSHSFIEFPAMVKVVEAWVGVMPERTVSLP